MTPHEPTASPLARKAEAGALDLAETLANSLTASEEQAKVLVSMTKGIAKAGGVGRAAKLIVRAEALVHSVRSTGSVRSL